jgi:hypothetical protein
VRIAEEEKAAPATTKAGGEEVMAREERRSCADGRQSIESGFDAIVL